MYKVIETTSLEEFERQLNQWGEKGYGLYHSHISLDGHVHFYTAILIKGFGKPEVYTISPPYFEQEK